jgi:hypothetical protein
MACVEVSEHRGMPTLNKTYSTGRNPLAEFSATTFVWLISTSLLFACIFEWDRYQIITIHRLHSLSLSDKALLIWLLSAKSMVWFGPLLPLCAALVALGLRRTAVFILNCFWILIFFLMALDLVSVWFSSYHAWDYFPSKEAILEHPQSEVHRWAADRLCNDPFVVFSFFVVCGPICFILAKWATVRLGNLFPWLWSDKSAVAFMAIFIVIVLGVAPFLILFNDKVVLDRTLNSVSSPTLLRECLRRLVRQPESQVGRAHAGYLESRSPVTGSPENMEDSHVRETSTRPEPLFDTKDELLALKYVHEAAYPGPADPDAFVKHPNLPNVILFVVESFRPSAVSPHLMKDLDAWSRQGLYFQRHYSGSNCSHLGLFSLLYSRCPIGYDQTLKRKIPAQFLQSLRKSGYEITFVTAGETIGFRRLDEFINSERCDHVCVVGEFEWEKKQDWPGQDSRKLARLKSIINEPRNQPQFIFCYLVSSMFRYAFPPEFNVLKESVSLWQFLSVKGQFESHFNRYANSLLFLEHELMNVLRSLDMEKNVVIITSDHGESMGEDGVFKHATRLSEVQIRVPCIMAGKGIEPGIITGATVHYDILPTLLHALGGTSVPIHHSHGRDLLAGFPRPDDEVVLGPADDARWEGVVIVRGDKRMVFTTQTSSSGTVVRFTGLVDDTGQFKTE